MSGAEGRTHVGTWLRGCGLLVAAFLALVAPAQAEPTLVPVGTAVTPTYVAGPPDDASRLFVTEKAGSVKVIRDGVMLDRPFLDLTGDVFDYFEGGLLSIAFAPDYATSGRFFVSFAANATASTIRLGELQVREYRRSATDPDLADPTSGRLLLAVEKLNAAHYGGQLQFAPDGKLWVSTGDDGNLAGVQDPTGLLGKLIRLDPDAATPTPEIMATGMRNPWRFSFDRATGQIVIADVGESEVEEINVGLAANYGWPCFEGSVRRISLASCDTGTTPPVLEKTRADGFCSIIGGYVVRDPGLPTLVGRYLYGDFCAPEVRSFDIANVATDAPTGLSVANVSSFGEDTCGRLLAVSVGGTIYRIVDGVRSACGTDVPPPPDPPADPPKDTPPPPPPPPQPPVRDTRACKVSASVSGLKSVRKLKRLTLTLKTDETCRATVSGKLSGVATFKTVRQNLVPGKSTVVRLKLTASGTRALRRTLGRRSSVKAALKVQAVDGAGNIRTLNRSATVRG